MYSIYFGSRHAALLLASLSVLDLQSVKSILLATWDLVYGMQVGLCEGKGAQ